MSARRTSAASPSASSAWWRSIADREPVRQAPAAGEHAADQRVVDAELAALRVHALLGRAGRRRGSGAGSPGRRGSARACRCRAAAPSTAARRGPRSRARGRAGRRRAGWRRRAGGSARACSVPARACARRSRRSRCARRAPRRPPGVRISIASGMLGDLALLARAALGWRSAARRSRARRRTRRRRPCRPPRCGPRAPGAARGCGTRRAPGRPRAPRSGGQSAAVALVLCGCWTGCCRAGRLLPSA